MWRRLPQQLPLVLGHRGARHRAPENTFAAFDLALDEGAAGIELDVRLDGSAEVIVLHDRTLERVTSGADPRDVEAMPTAAVRQADVGRGERVPLLGEVIAWAKRRDALVNVELKSDVTQRRLLVARTVALLAREPAGRFLLSSFHPGMVRQALTLTRAIMRAPLPVALLTHAGSPWVDRRPTWRTLGADAIHPEACLVTPARMQAWQRQGALVNAWTVNDAERAVELADLGVDALITDDPRGVLAALR